MNVRLAGLSSALCFLFAATAFGQAPTVVTTLPTPSGQGGSFASQFTAVGDAIYFYADLPYESAAIWKWTEAGGVVRVKSVAQDSYQFVYPALLAFGDKLLIGGRVSGVDAELWISDGTSAGTTLLKDIYPGGSSYPVPAIVAGTKAYFTATDLEHGRELWVTDGTTAGTTLVKDLTGDSESSSPSSFVERNGLVYFTALDQLFVTDGTEAGTVSLATGVKPFSLGVLANRVVFLGSDESNGRELWSTDGTVPGTAMLKDINPGPASSWGGLGTSFVKRGTSLIFFAEDATSGRELWITDGTASGTTLVKDITPGTESSQMDHLVASDSGAFFVVGGTTLWFSDGTEAGTLSVASYGSVVSMVAAANGAYLFTPGTSTARVLHFSNGTAAGTTDFPDVTAYAPLTSTGGLVLFNGRDATHGVQPWITDGTEAGTHALGPLPVSLSFAPLWMRAAGSNVFMPVGEKLFRSNGTAAGTFEVATLASTYHHYSSIPTAAVGNLLLFANSGGTAPTNGLWKSDGTVAGTGLVKAFYNIQMIAGTSQGYALLWGSEEYSCCTVPLWRTDGTAAGTTVLATTNTPHSFVELGGRVYFLAGSQYGGPSQLWRTEGTQETTRILMSGAMSGLGVAGGNLYITKFLPDSGHELWKSDGTADGVALVKDINPGEDSSQPASFASIGRILLFTADDGTHGRELWRTDGTEAGTFLLKDIYPGVTASNISGLTQSGRYVYFHAYDNVHGVELWRTDGTVAGTILLSDVGNIGPLTAADGKLVFPAQTTTHGWEVWETDGTPAGTFLVADLVPGSGSIVPQQLTVAGERLFLATNDARLWARARATSRLTIGDRRVAEGDSGSTIVQFTVTREGSTSGAATVNFATEDFSATAGADYQTTSGVVSFASGETTKQISVTILGDTALEQNESFGVVLSAATGATIIRDRAVGIIEENDRRVALSIEYVPSTTSWDSRRRFRITNSGPSLATVTLNVSESPYAGVFNCDGKNPSVCNVGPVPAGESVEFTVQRSSGGALTDPSYIPGRTLTARISALEGEDDLSDNETVRMINNTGTYSLPPYLVAGTTAVARVAGSGHYFAETVYLNLTGGVVVSPSSALVTAAEPVATFELTVAPNAWGWSTVSNGSNNLMRIPIVLPSEHVKLDTTMVAPPWYTLDFDHAEPVVIPVTVNGVLPDGTHPSGTISLRRVSDDALIQNQPLDVDGKATFTVNGLAVGSHDFRIAYPGDQNFNGLTVELHDVDVHGWPTRTNLVVHRNACGSSQLIITVWNENDHMPTGSVTVNINQTAYQLSLVPTATPGEARATMAYAFTSTSYTSISVLYVPDAPFTQSGTSDYVTPMTCPAPTLIASAVSGSSVSLIWSNVGADAYDILRAQGPSHGTFTVVGTTNLSSFTDSTATAGTSYLYKVAAKTSAGVVRSTSASDLATTVIFTDDPIVFRSTRTKMAHITELRQAANALRALTGQAPLTFAAIAVGMPIKASDITELRTAIGAALTAAGRPAVTWVDGVGAGKPVKALHIQQMRNVVK